MSKPYLIAHRGASLRAPENSMAAFELAAEFGADWIELDVQLSADGEAIVFHDDELGRMTKEEGPISHRSAAELEQIPLGDGGGGTIPTLPQVLERCGSTPLYIEIKSDGSGMSFQRNRSLLDRCCELVAPDGPHALASFDIELVRESIRRGMPTILIFSAMVAAETLSESERHSLIALSARGDLLELGALQLASKTDTPLWLWTVDDPDAMRRAMEAGAHGICSNDVELARSVIDSWRK